MRPAIPSVTAAVVAIARAASGSRAARALSLGLVDHVSLRARAIDRALLDATASGTAPQVVLLGAGLDARAFRMRELGDATVFEVDHPATQAVKRARRRAPVARALVWVAIDFERERVDDALARAGHDDSRATFWIWEGVTPYLRPEARGETLRAIAGRSASGSRLAVTYAVPRPLAAPPRWAPPVRALAMESLRWIGEPIRGLIEPEALAHELAGAGFHVAADTGLLDWATAAGRSGSAGATWPLAVARALIGERLAVAERKDSTRA